MSTEAIVPFHVDPERQEMLTSVSLDLYDFLQKQLADAVEQQIVLLGVKSLIARKSGLDVQGFGDAVTIRGTAKGQA